MTVIFGHISAAITARVGNRLNGLRKYE